MLFLISVNVIDERVSGVARNVEDIEALLCAVVSGVGAVPGNAIRRLELDENRRGADSIGTQLRPGRVFAPAVVCPRLWDSFRILVAVDGDGHRRHLPSSSDAHCCPTSRMKQPQ